MIKERKELLTFGMGKLFRKLAIPSMLGMLIVGLYNLADAFFVGKYVGKEAVGAVALIYMPILLNQAIFYLTGSGASSLFSISIGRNDKKTISKIFSNLVLITLVITGIYSVLAFIFASEITAFLGAKNEMQILATQYLKIIAIGFIPAALGPALNFLVRGEGKMKQAMIMMGIPGVLNIILDGLLIGVFDMGIRGAGIATISSQIVFAILTFSYFIFSRSTIKLKESQLAPDKKIISKILKVGFPQLIMMVMALVQQVILFKLLAYYGGNDHITLMGATYRIFMFAYLIVWGFGAGLQPVVGMNFGAKQYSRVKKSFTYFTKISLMVSTVTWILFMVFPNQFLSSLIKDPMLVQNNVYLFLIFNSIFFGYAFFATTINFFIGIGNSKEAGILMISRQILFFIPLVLILPLFFGITGVWISMPLADLFCLILTIILKKKVSKKELEKEDAKIELDKENLEKY